MQTILSGFKTYTGFYAMYNQLKKQLPCVGQKGGILMEKIFQSISGNNTLMYKRSLFLASLCGSVFNSNSYNKKKKSALFVNLSGNIFQLQASYSWGLWKSQNISFR